MTHPFRLIVFDFDGTLVDSQRFIATAMARAFEDQGFPAPTPEAVRRIIGLRLETAAARLPEETVMIGDTSYDMEMAVNAGVAALGVDWGYHGAEELRASGAAHVIESFPGLPAALSNLD